MKTIIFLFFTVCMLISCKESAPPLSEYEKQHLLELKNEFNQKNKQYKAYKAEKTRISIVEKSYLKNNIELENFSIFKTNKFDDGRDRACYKGVLRNNGNEIIEALDLKVTFLSNDSIEKINTWEPSLIKANDELLDKMELDKTKALIMALSGRQLPLKPKKSKSLTDNKNCMSDVFLDWQVKDVKYELANIKLRPKLTEIDPFHSIDLQLEIAKLEERQNNN